MVEENTQTTTEETTDQQTTQDTQNQQTNDTATETTKDTTDSKDEGTLLGGEDGKEEEVKVDVPEKYEFKMPEGMEDMELDQAAIDMFSPIFKDIGLSQESAQKLVDAYAPYVKQQVEAQKTAAANNWTKQVSDWKTETTKELGANYKQDLSTAGKFIEKFGSPELRTMLNDTGMGNHPELVKAFVKAGKAISEDVFVEPDKKTTPAQGGVNLDKLYDNPSGKT